MTYIPPSTVAALLVLLSVVGILIVVRCLQGVDFLRPPGQRPRVDHPPPAPPLKGLARTTATHVTLSRQRTAS